MFSPCSNFCSLSMHSLLVDKHWFSPITWVYCDSRSKALFLLIGPIGWLMRVRVCTCPCMCVCVCTYMFYFETGIQIKPSWLQIPLIAQALLDLMVLLSPPLLYWHDRCASSPVVLGIEPQNLGLLCNHPSASYISSKYMNTFVRFFHLFISLFLC